MVNAWVFEHQKRTTELDAHYVAKLERSVIQWPQDPARRAHPGDDPASVVPYDVATHSGNTGFALNRR